MRTEKVKRKKKDYVRDIQYIPCEGIFKEFAFKKQFIFLPFSTCSYATP